MKELKKNNLRTALVSSASKDNLDSLFLEGLDINYKDLFDVTAHGETTPNKKPSPEVYEWTLEKLKLPSSACIAIEDSPRGLQSALKANIKVLVTPSKLTEGESFQGAKIVVSDLGEESKPFKLLEGESFGFKKVSLQLLKKIHKLD